MKRGLNIEDNFFIFFKKMSDKLAKFLISKQQEIANW